MFIILCCLPTACVTPLHTVEINEYILLPNGKPMLGKEQGLTAFIFENNQTKIPFAQYVGLKYKTATFTEVEYWISIDGHRFKVMLYDADELQKYFDTSQFMVSNVEPEMNIKGSKANFVAVSVINEMNDDCLAEGSLYQNMVINYLRQLRHEYYNS